MDKFILVYITCESKEQAEDIGRQLLKKWLAGCVNIIPGMRSAYLWPPGKNYLEEADEVILLCKAIEKHYAAVEKEVLKLHSYKNPAIFALPITHMSKKYADWLTGELHKSKRARAYESLWKIIEEPTKRKPMGWSKEDEAIYSV